MSTADSSAPELGCWVAPDPTGVVGDWLVAIGVESGSDSDSDNARPPIDLVLVIDRSSSMVGPRIAAAVEAARQICLRLSEEDRVGVVAFDSSVQTVRRPGSATAETAAEVAVALAELGVGYGTNISAGWKRAANLIGRGGIPGASKTILLLTDGLPSRGIRKAEDLESLIASGTDQGIVTNAVGIGDRFDEKLLARMAVAGGGAYRFAEHDEETPAIADEEVEGLLGMVAESAVLHIGFAQAVRRYEVLHELTCRSDGDGLAVELGRLYSTRPRSVLLQLAVEEGTRHLGAVGLSCVGGEESWKEAGPARILLAAPGQEASDARRVGAVYIPLRVARWQQKIWDCGRDSSTDRLHRTIAAAKEELEGLPETLTDGEVAREALSRFEEGCERIVSALESGGRESDRRRQTESVLKSLTEESTLTVMGVTRAGSQLPRRRRRGWGKR